MNAPLNHFEELESRQLLSTAGGALVTSSVNAGVLNIRGSQFKDVMTVRPNGNRIEVWDQRIAESTGTLFEPMQVKMVDVSAAGITRIEVHGWFGNDEIRIEHGLPAATLFGDEDNDKLHGGDGDDDLYGGPGDDHLWGHGGSDYLIGGSGADRFDGGRDSSGADFDIVSYQDRTNTVYVTYNSDVSVEVLGGDDGESGEHDDVEDNVECVFGGEGDDQLSADGARDDRGHWIYGCGGNDTITCSKNNDVAFGGNGNDYIYGRGGNDFLYGENGSDHLFGEAGDDFLDGTDFSGIVGRDNHYTDFLDGGDGRDTARYGVTTVFVTSYSDDRISNCEIFKPVGEPHGQFQLGL